MPLSPFSYGQACVRYYYYNHYTATLSLLRGDLRCKMVLTSFTLSSRARATSRVRTCL